MTKTGDVWNVEELLEGKKFDDIISGIKSSVEKFKDYRPVLSKDLSASKLLEIIREEEKIVQSLSQIETYYSLKFMENNKNSEILAKKSMLEQISADISNDIEFFDLWFKKLDDETASKFIQSSELKNYKYHLEKTKKESKYSKSEEIERILTIKDTTGSDSFAEIYKMIVDNYSFEFNGKKVSSNDLISKYNHKSPQIREKAIHTLLSRYRKDSELLTEIYKNVVLSEGNDSVKIRGYPNYMNSVNQSEDVSDKSVDTLLDVVRKNSGYFKEYFEIKHTFNNKGGEIYPFSRYHLLAPIKSTGEKKYTYQEGKEMSLDILKEFDERFYSIAKRIFDEKHVHSIDMPAKDSGAYCIATPGYTPFILLNYKNKLEDINTTMHELGHGIHYDLTQQNQSFYSFDPGTPLAETASIFNEMLLADRIIRQSKNKKEKIALLAGMLERQYATISRQAYITLFEKFAHENIPKGATKEDLDNHYHSLLKEQFGKMKIPPEYKSEWNYIPHIYLTPFYCYGYSWGGLFSTSLYNMYQKEEKQFVDKYVNFLSSGGSASPYDTMNRLGANPESEEFWQGGFNIIKNQLEELKKLI